MFKHEFFRNLSLRLRNSTAAMVVGTGLLGSAAFAQTTDTMDVSTPLAYLAAAVVAINLVGPAKAGIKFLKFAWNKIS